MIWFDIISSTKVPKKDLLVCGSRWSLSSSSSTPSWRHQTCSLTSQRSTSASVPFTPQWRRALAWPTRPCCLRSLDSWPCQRYRTTLKYSHRAVNLPEEELEKKYTEAQSKTHPFPYQLISFILNEWIFISVYCHDFRNYGNVSQYLLPGQVGQAVSREHTHTHRRAIL